MTLKYLLSGFRKSTLYAKFGYRYKIEGDELVEIPMHTENEPRSLHKLDLLAGLQRLKAEGQSSTPITYSVKVTDLGSRKYRVGTDLSIADTGGIRIGCQLFDEESSRRLREWASS